MNKAAIFLAASALGAAAAVTPVVDRVAAEDLTAAEVMWLAENAWDVQPAVLEELAGAHFTLNKLDCSFLSALKSEPFRFMNFQHFCAEAQASIGETFLRTTSEEDGALVNLKLAPKTSGPRRLADDTAWSGITIARNRSAVVLGTVGDVGVLSLIHI